MSSGLYRAMNTLEAVSLLKSVKRGALMSCESVREGGFRVCVGLFSLGAHNEHSLGIECVALMSCECERAGLGLYLFFLDVHNEHGPGEESGLMSCPSVRMGKVWVARCVACICC